MYKRLFYVYSKVDCPYCKRAIALLKKEKEQFAVIVMDHAQEALEMLADVHSHNTVPIVCVGSPLKGPNMARFIGGFTELKEFFKQEQEEKDANQKAQENQANKAIDTYEKTTEETQEQEE